MKEKNSYGSIPWINGCLLSHPINMIDHEHTALIDRHQNGNVLLIEEAHQPADGLLDLAVEECSAVKQKRVSRDECTKHA